MLCTSKRQCLFFYSMLKANTARSSTTVFASSSPLKSARSRMMQRQSIHDPKRPHEQPRVPTPIADHKSPSRQTPKPPPATQIVNRASPRKRAPIQEPSRPTVPKAVVAPQMIVKLPLGPSKRKRDPNEFTPAVTRSQARAQADKSGPPPTKPLARMAPRRAMPLAETQLINEPAAKRKKPNPPHMPAPARPQVNESTGGSMQVSTNAADMVKTSPRKTAVPPTQASCNPCKRSRLTCDHAHPICGNCKNRPRATCVYGKPAGSRSQLKSQAPSSPQKKPTNNQAKVPPQTLSNPQKKQAAKSSAAAGRSRAGDGFGDGFLVASNDELDIRQDRYVVSTNPAALAPKKTGSGRSFVAKQKDLRSSARTPMPEETAETSSSTTTIRKMDPTVATSRLPSRKTYTRIKK
jgi:hypothetical protein